MTPARKAALQWFYERGAILDLCTFDSPPSAAMMDRMFEDGQLAWLNRVGYVLTDKGRRMLHGDDK